MNRQEFEHFIRQVKTLALVSWLQLAHVPAPAVYDNWDDEDGFSEELEVYCWKEGMLQEDFEALQAEAANEIKKQIKREEQKLELVNTDENGLPIFSISLVN